MKKKVEKSVIKVVELFAGVGGFRIGLENSGNSFKVVWSNQWEPSTKKQHASEVYESRFGKENHSNVDIAKVPTKDVPEHDLLVGGFPCQDYSVARTLSHAQGLIGKKGVLWWQIQRILKEKGSKAPKFLMLENVDRLLKSPAKQRGRDFAVMLGSLSQLGYAVEWRVINAAEYGMPQRRRRIYIMAYKIGNKLNTEIKKSDKKKWLINNGLIAQAFPVEAVTEVKTFNLDKDLEKITEEFNKTGGNSPFENAGVVYDSIVYTIKTKPKYNGEKTVLKDIIIPDNLVPKEYFIDEKDFKQWQYLKGAKSESRKTKDGFIYKYAEGSMIFPDKLDQPSRTIITGEGGQSPSRFKHVIKTKSGKLRRLTPIELERLCMFPDNHTAGVPDVRRAFFMGNALVVGVIKKLGEVLSKRSK